MKIANFRNKRRVAKGGLDLFLAEVDVTTPGMWPWSRYKTETKTVFRETKFSNWMWLGTLHYTPGNAVEVLERYTLLKDDVPGMVTEVEV
jgi:hypothetical protein